LYIPDKAELIHTVSSLRSFRRQFEGQRGLMYSERSSVNLRHSSWVLLYIG